MKCHIGVDAESGFVHTVAVTAANEHDITQTANLLYAMFACANLYAFATAGRKLSAT